MAAHAPEAFALDPERQAAAQHRALLAAASFRRLQIHAAGGEQGDALRGPSFLAFAIGAKGGDFGGKGAGWHCGFLVVAGHEFRRAKRQVDGIRHAPEAKQNNINGLTEERTKSEHIRFTGYGCVV